MSQLSQLMEQAKNRRGINDLFKTKVDALAFTKNNKDSKSQCLDYQLAELESILFEQAPPSTQVSEKIIETLEELLEEL